MEKIPLLLLSLAFSALTVHTQVNAIQSLETVSWASRGANTLIAYVSYLSCFFWPQALAILYPHPADGFPAGKVVAAAVVLAIVSAGVLAARRRAPYLLVGWLWYLGMLVPVIGLLQVGGQRMADRYTYLPQIGLVLGLVWAATDFTGFLAARLGAAVGPAGGRRQKACAAWRFLAAISTGGILAALTVAAWQQTGYWRDSETLWVRDLMYPNLVGHYNLGLTLAANHRYEEAIQQFELACEITAKDEDTLYSYAQSLEALERVEEAMTKYRAVLAVNEKSVGANDGLARILLKQGKDREALACWRHALDADPKNVVIGNKIAGLLAASPVASVRNGQEAVRLARKIVEITAGKDPVSFDTLAAAQAEAGDFEGAVRSAQTALALSADRGEETLAAEFRERLKLYRAGKPYRRPPVDTKKPAGTTRPRASAPQK